MITIDDLPDEMLETILTQLSVLERQKVRLVNNRFKSLLNIDLLRQERIDKKFNILNKAGLTKIDKYFKNKDITIDTKLENNNLEINCILNNIKLIISYAVFVNDIYELYVDLNHLNEGIVIFILKFSLFLCIFGSKNNFEEDFKHYIILKDSQKTIFLLNKVLYIVDCFVSWEDGPEYLEELQGYDLINIDKADKSFSLNCSRDHNFNLIYFNKHILIFKYVDIVNKIAVILFGKDKIIKAFVSDKKILITDLQEKIKLYKQNLVFTKKFKQIVDDKNDEQLNQKCQQFLDYPVGEEYSSEMIDDFIDYLIQKNII